MRSQRRRSWRRLRGVAAVLTPAMAFVLAGCLPDFLSNDSAESGAQSQDGTTGQVNRSGKTGLFSGGGEPQLESTRTLKQGKEVGKIVTRATSASLQRGPDPSTAGLVVSSRGESELGVADIDASLGLSDFFSVLARLESAALQRPVTILHLGDERLAMDRFGGDLRQFFQSRFGNAGRGMMSPGRPFPYHRARGMQIRQTGKWEVANSLAGDTGPFGLTGIRLTSKASKSSVSLKVVNEQFGWTEVSFLAGPGGGRATVSIAAKEGEVIERQIVDTEAETLQSKRLRLNQAGQILKVTAEDDRPVTIFSWSIGNGRPGIRYVSLGVPGATAGTAELWDVALVEHEIQQLNPDLIILGYGTNESFDDMLNVAVYESSVSETISRLKSVVPGASLIVLGPPDIARLPDYAGRSTGAVDSVPCRRLSSEEINTYPERIRTRDRQLARWHPPITLDKVRAVLRRIAARNGVYFWDWSKAMGGSCGIHAWVHRDPPLAAPDHRNFTDKGAKRSALALFQDLMNGYSNFRRQARQRQ